MKEMKEDMKVENEIEEREREEREKEFKGER
jgi:hypothetical protein